MGGAENPRKTPEHIRERIYAYQRENPERVLSSRLGTCAKNPTHRNAYRAVDAAINAGAVERPAACVSCGCVPKGNTDGYRIEAHHEDYTKPLEVMWLCTPCHRRLHAQRAEKVPCPFCGQLITASRMVTHKKFKHGDAATAA